ncbi:MAG TPA: serine hydrolase domain-containing protein [Thermoanaerobaculia bacterium]|nr:serine hydrolase domain-containing protein [Thermoanaerobaculia bacterium]
MAALLAAFETGTPDAIRAFVQANFAASSQKEVPLEQRVGRLGGMAKEVGPLQFDGVLKGEAPEVSFLARSKKSGEWIEVGMRLEPAPPFGIMGLRFENSEGPGAEVATPLGTDAAVAAKAGETLRALSEKGAFSGVVLLARNGTPFFFEACGSADRDFGVPNRKDTKFNLGSINKIFTQAAIAQLAAAGKLSLSDTIRRHLPDYPNPAADRITIQELVTMSSGLGDIFGKKYDATPKARLRTLADFLSLFADEPLLFEPGTSRRYSNAGYVVLGLIIERASGQGYHDYVREHLFRPAGMKDTDAYAQDSIVPNRAVGYTREAEGDAPSRPDAPLHVNIYALPAVSSSAGGGYSTAADLLAFDQAMRANRLLSPEWTDWFYSDKTHPPSPDAPARKRGGGFGFAGGTAGVNAVLECDLDTGATVVVLSNLDPPSAESLARKLRGWMGL